MKVENVISGGLTPFISGGLTPFMVFIYSFRTVKLCDARDECLHQRMVLETSSFKH